MTDRPDDRTQPIAIGATNEQQPAAAGGPAWASAAHEGDGTASARPVPVAAMAPAAPYGPSVPPIAADPAERSWRSRVGGGRGLAVAALLVGLGLGAVGGAAVTYAATAGDDRGSIADGTGGFDRDDDGDFGRHGGRGGPPPGGELPDGQLPGGGTGQLPGGGGTGSDANGTAPAT